MKQIKEGKVVIATDSHQNLDYLNKIINIEEPFDYFIHNGDHLDTFYTPDNKTIFSVSAVCEWINERVGDERFIWHVANHDCAYLASYIKDYIKTRQNPYYHCSGWSKNKAKYFNKHINPEWINKLSLCTLLGENTVVSHAGFHYRHFQPYTSELNNIKELSLRWENEKHTFHLEPWHWIWDVGSSRGGMAVVGSPIWMDWGEFVPLDGVRQIVGHSTTQTPSIRLKRNGIGLENYCVDCMQQTYCVWENGNIEVKQLSGEKLINFDDYQTIRLD